MKGKMRGRIQDKRETGEVAREANAGFVTDADSSKEKRSIIGTKCRCMRTTTGYEEMIIPMSFWTADMKGLVLATL